MINKMPVLASIVKEDLESEFSGATIGSGGAIFPHTDFSKQLTKRDSYKKALSKYVSLLDQVGSLLVKVGALILGKTQGKILTELKSIREMMLSLSAARNELLTLKLIDRVICRDNVIRELKEVGNYNKLYLKLTRKQGADRYCLRVIVFLLENARNNKKKMESYRADQLVCITSALNACSLDLTEDVGDDTEEMYQGVLKAINSLNKRFERVKPKIH